MESSDVYPSKKAQKRAQKEQRYLLKREADREAKRAAKKARRDASQAKWEALSPEEQAEQKRLAAIAREARIASLKEQAAELEAAASAPKPTVVIDLSFDDLMTDREISSLAQQLSYCHSANRRGSFPVNLVFSSLGGRTEAKLDAHTGWHNWKVQRDHRSFLDVFRHADIIYLSSEAEEALDTLNSSSIYIIGGLVDHNRHKGLTHRNAVSANIRTARLPIDEHVKMSQRRVLAVNHVTEIMVNRAAGLEWPAALMKAMPERRGATVAEVGANTHICHHDSTQQGQQLSTDCEEQTQELPSHSAVCHEKLEL